MAQKQFTEIHFYTVLVIDSLQLLVDEHDVRSVEVIEDVQTQLESGEESAGVVGWLAYGEDQYPVFSFSPNLDLMMQVPAKRRFCVLLHTEGEEAIFGVVCDSFQQLLPEQNLHAQDIPPVMKLPNSPISKLVVHNNALGCVTNAENLVSYIAAWGETHMASVDV